MTTQDINFAISLPRICHALNEIIFNKNGMIEFTRNKQPNHKHQLYEGGILIELLISLWVKAWTLISTAAINAIGAVATLIQNLG